MCRLPARTRLFALLCCLVLASMTSCYFFGAAAHAATGFTPQARLGFLAGDDWEPALAADRYGHVYVLYKHYDVAGQTSCASCALHVLFQISHDRGQTWNAPRPIDPEPVVGGQYDSQILVDPVDGKTIWASFLQNSKSSIAVMKSTDFGQTWLGPTIVDNLQRATDKDELTVRGSTIAVAYNAAQKIYASISHDGGQTWSLTPVGVSGAPYPCATGSGDVRIAWTDTRTGSWNLFYRSSSDGGASWSSEARVSSYVPGFSSITPTGFGLPYGDYFEMAVDDRGSTQLAWGEAGSYAGPGNIWTAHN